MVSNADIAEGRPGPRNVNECGLFRSDDRARSTARSDQDWCAAPGMPWTPRMLRMAPQPRDGPAEAGAAAAVPVVMEV